jgi:hypothetical protein
MMTIKVNEAPRVHVRFEGRSYDFYAAEFNLAPQASDEAVRLAVAMFFEVPLKRLAPYVVERHANGNLTVRPEAVFG